MRKEIERLVSVMERALKNDTSVELWNVDLDKLEKIGFNFREDFLSVNVYHLNDVYSTQYTLYSNNTISRSESYSITKFSVILYILILTWFLSKTKLNYSTREECHKHHLTLSVLKGLPRKLKRKIA